MNPLRLMRTQGFFLAAALVAAALFAPSQALCDERALVLPLQPAEGTEYDGLGPAVQNIIENVLALHPGLEETYLLRHMRGPFPTAGDLQSYILGKRPADQPLAGLAREGARYVLDGRVLPGLQAEVRVRDLFSGTSASAILPIDAQNGLVGFRRGLLELLGQMDGLALPPAQAEKALTPYITGSDALRTFGRSYGSYLVLAHLGNRAYLDLDLSKRAAMEAPQSYLALNMYGWQLLASRKDLDLAAKFFRQALSLDPSGVDALDGMMQIGLRRGGADQATPWVLRKAKTRGAEIGSALAEMHMMIGNNANTDKRPAVAAAHFRTAAALYPEAELPYIDLALTQYSLGGFQNALKTLDARLAKPSTAAVKAILLNFKARLYWWASIGAQKEGKTDQEKKALGAALAILKACPVPDAHEYSLVLQRLAYLSAMQGDVASAQGFLKTIPFEKGTDRLFVDTLRAYVQARGEDKEQARELAMLCLNTVAERLRTHEPVPPAVFGLLSKSFELLGNGELTGSLKRLGEAPGDLEGKPG